MLGGGNFTFQNKILPGAYINFISANKGSIGFAGRGIAAMPLELDWGEDVNLFEVTSENFQKDSMKIFGYDFSHQKLKGLRDLFQNINKLIAYRLNKGEKATCNYGTAKFSGIRGNDLKVIIKTNIDNSTKFDISVHLGNLNLGTQTVTSAAELIDNDYIIFNKESTLTATAGVALTGGTNGTVTTTNHQNFLDRAESYTFNTLGVMTTENSIKQLYVNFTKRLRDQIGIKFQTILYNNAANYEGIINVKNSVDLVYFVTGLIAGCEVNKSTLNRAYTGEFDITADYTQTQLEDALKAGEFTLHKVGNELRVLGDVNSLVTTTAEKGEIFKDNQTIRVIDQVAIDIANIFNTKYLGSIPNDANGRISLWGDIVKHHEALQSIRAIENFTGEDVVVSAGFKKTSVVINDSITIVNAMAQLYMSITVA